MAILADHLFESSDDLAQVVIALGKDTHHSDVVFTITTLTYRGARRTKVARLRSDDVAGLENVPEVLRILGQMWLWEDSDLATTAVRLVKKGRRPAAQ